MHYTGTIIRPPNEADSLLLQVSLGCSHNRCSFCGAYKDKKFSIAAYSRILEDIRYAALHFPSKRRLFLCDGDALILPQKLLKEILSAIRTHLPQIRQVGSYANGKSIRSKTGEQLKELKAWGLKKLYMGLESGDEPTLQAVCKGSTAAELIAAGCKVRECGIKLSVTVLNGIAGRHRSQIHARETGKVLTAINPQHVGALTVILIPGTPLWQQARENKFLLPEPAGMLRELITMLEHTHLSRGIFSANHASNYVPMQIHLPRDKQKGIEQLRRVLEHAALKPEWQRGL